jgi:hypothetical protein
MVADALERAGQICFDSDYDRLGDAIRAMIPADHAAALAARDERMRADGRREGMEQATRIGLDMLDALKAKPGSAARSVILEYRAAIRAEMGGEA